MVRLYGKLVDEISSEYPAGRNEVIWNGEDFNGVKLSDGTYYYRLQTEKFSAIKKLVLVK